MLDVLPIPTLQNGVYALRVNFITFCKRNNVSSFGANLQHIRFPKFAHAVLYTFNAWRFVSAFFPGVLLIFNSSAQEQMIWAHALRVITRMTNLFAFRHRTEMQMPRNNVCADILPIPTLDSSIAMSPIIASCPQPASVSFANFWPKSLFQWNGFLGYFPVAALTAIFSRRMRGWSKCATTP